MTAMGMTMDNSIGNISSDIEAVQVSKPEPLKNVKKNSAFNSTYVKPLAIVGGLVTVGIVAASVQLATPEAEKRSVDGGQVDTILVDGTLTGSDEMDSNQAQFISKQQLEEAEKNAKEGVTTAAVVNRAKVSSTGVSYSTSTASDVSAITTKYQSVPRTLDQLSKENAAASGMIYQETMDDDGNIIFMNRKTKEIIYPIDVVRQTSLNTPTAAPNATMATNYNEQGGGDGGGNGGGNGANNGGGNNQGSASGGNNQDGSQEQQVRSTGAEPLIDARRETLNTDFMNQQAQREADAQALAQYNQQRQAEFQQAQQARAQSANTALNDAIAQVKGSTGAPSNNRYKPVSYIAAAQNGPQGIGQNQGGYNQNGGQNNGYGGYTQNQNGGYGGYGGYGQNQGFDPNQGGYAPNQGFNPDQSFAPPIAMLNEPYNGQAAYAPQNAPNTNTTYPMSGVQMGGYSGGVPYAPNAQTSNTISGQYPVVSNNSQGIIMDNRLPINVVRAGTKWQAVITKSVNTDEGLQVVGELVTGKFAGSTVYGVIEQSGRDVGVRFTSIAPPNPRKPLIPLAAFATTISGQKTAVSTDRVNHYAQNYGIMTLTSILRGVGEAYEGSGETSVITDSGNVITTKDSEPSSKKIRAEVLGEFGDKLNEDIAKLGGRAPTYKVAIGTVLNVVLSNDLDINGTASSIGDAAQSTLGGNSGQTSR